MRSRVLTQPSWVCGFGAQSGVGRTGRSARASRFAAWKNAPYAAALTTRRRLGRSARPCRISWADGSAGRTGTNRRRRRSIPLRGRFRAHADHAAQGRPDPTGPLRPLSARASTNVRIMRVPVNRSRVVPREHLLQADCRAAGFIALVRPAAAVRISIPARIQVALDVQMAI